MNVLKLFDFSYNYKSIKQELLKINNKQPLIHFITNYVTSNGCANMSLRIGASPIMADELLEVEDITKISNCLVINIGTVNNSTFQSMKKSCEIANKLNIPIILDPCGVGCTYFRNDVVKYLINNYHFSVIRGNASEVLSIYNLIFDREDRKQKEQKGVDCSIDIDYGYKEKIGTILSKKLKCVICTSGEIDLIIENDNISYCKYGDKIMTRITGAGCMLTAIIGCFCAVSDDFYLSTSLACKFYGKNYKKLLFSKKPVLF